MIEVKNIYDSENINLTKEYFEDILKEKGFRLERIISFGNITENNFWYDQDEDEFVLLLKGAAKIQLENQSILTLGEGDYIIIPAHVKHKVIYTDTKIKTYWLTCYFQNNL